MRRAVMRLARPAQSSIKAAASERSVFLESALGYFIKSVFTYNGATCNDEATCRNEDELASLGALGGRAENSGRMQHMVR